MPFHFDGLATMMAFRFGADGQLSQQVKHFESELSQHYEECIFLGTGTGPTLGKQLCTKNPSVNILPIDGQLWLTIDTAAWGRVTDTLETVKNASVEVPSLVLNAHPTCDPKTKECFVQHPCKAPGGLPYSQDQPWSDIACVSKLIPSSGDDMTMKTVQYSNATMPKTKIIQHSHSPCITPNFVISKLDSFGPRLKWKDTGMLKELHQVEDDEWLVMDRRTNTSVVIPSNIKFVNNHFWNCFEKDEQIIVDTIPATADYLDSYFKTQLSKPTEWGKILKLPPQRCVINSDDLLSGITCNGLLQKDNTTRFDYPTFNPAYKMNPDYQYMYGIGPSTESSRWFDRVLKVHSPTGKILKTWSAPNVFVSEADYVPHADAAHEDDGLLLSVLYNQTSDSSSLMVFDAATLEPVSEYPLPGVVPFHAHGIVCTNGHCAANP